MTGGPWHCGFPMRPTGGYQAGTPTKRWVAFYCENCQHQETAWGHVERLANGTDKFVPQPKRTLTVVMHKPYPTTDEVMCRGLSQDEIIFTNLLFINTDTAVQQIGKHYSVRGFRCVFDLPKGTKS